jgi:hypothetical protein
MSKKSHKKLTRIKKSYTKFEKMLNEEVEDKKKMHCSPLFKENDREFVTISQNNLFYGYRTTMRTNKTSLLTVKGKLQNRPQSSKGNYIKQNQDTLSVRTRNVFNNQKRRPMSALREGTFNLLF